MRAVLLLLLLANLAMFAWRQGWLGPTADSGREPERAARQIAADRIRVLTPPPAPAAGAAAGDVGPVATAAGPSCLEFGDFDEASLARVQARLASLSLGDRLRARTVAAPGWFVVHLPPLPTRADAERIAQELRGRGIRDLIVMGQNSTMPNAIVLGSFRDVELAQRQQAELSRRGVGPLQVTQRPGNGEATRFEIRGVDGALAQRLAEIQKEFPQSQLGACPG